jgi:tetratricopeptide (TPR) repeat protein
MKRWWVATCAVVVLGCNLERNKSDKLVNEAVRTFKAGDTAGAIVQFNEAVTIDPSNDAAFYQRGLLRAERASQPEEAARDFEKAIELNPEVAQYHYHLGKVQGRLKRWPQAINAFSKAIEKNPAMGESHFELGVALQNQAQFDRAQEEFIQAIKLKPRFGQPYQALGNLYARFEKYPQAIQVFKNGIENNPEFPELHHDLAVIYKNQQRYDDAIAAFQAAIKLKPTFTNALFNLGIAYFENDNAEQAIHHLRLFLARRANDEEPLRVRTAEDTIAKLEYKAANPTPPSVP